MKNIKLTETESEMIDPKLDYVSMYANRENDTVMLFEQYVPYDLIVKVLDGKTATLYEVLEDGSKTQHTLEAGVNKFESLPYGFRFVSSHGATMQSNTAIYYIDASECKATDIDFNGCRVLEELYMPQNGQTDIIERMFFACGLTELTIPEGYTTIYTCAFEQANIKTLGLPSTISLLKTNAFFGSSVTTINYNGTIAEWNAITKETNWNYGKSFTIHCTDGDVTA